LAGNAVNQDNGKRGTHAARCGVLRALGRFIKVVLSKVCNLGQVAGGPCDTLSVMAGLVTILDVEKDGEDGVIVTFSDGTTGGYVAEELLFLRPIRETVGEPKGQILRQSAAMQA
jgi:hypothetical protein